VSDGAVVLVSRGVPINNGSGLARGDRKRPLNEAQIPHLRGVRVALGTGYNLGEGSRRAWRNGRERNLISSHPISHPKPLPARLATCSWL
jgi:hypothetical protein